MSEYNDGFDQGFLVASVDSVKYLRKKAAQWAVLRSMEATYKRDALNKAADEIEADLHTGRI